VLCGVQVADDDHPEFHTFLDELGYHYWDESTNPGYELFLK
jgi:threonine dehydratase